MKVRLAAPPDLAKLEALRRASPQPESLFYSPESLTEIALSRLSQLLTSQQEHPDWRVLVLTESEEVRGYLVFEVDHKHGITQQLQAKIVDHVALSFDALCALTARARKIVTAFENEYLVIDLPAADQRQQLWFYRCGFRAEQQRVARLIPRGYAGVESPDFRLRPAGDADLPFILETHAAYSRAYRPAGRDVDLETLELHFQMTYLALDLAAHGDGVFYFLMEEVSTGAPAGYLFVQQKTFAKQTAYYIYDVAIAPAFAGRGLSVYLRGAAETLAGREGALVYGDGTLDSPALKSWHEQMGYAVDSKLWALDCRPSAPQP